eukprot:EC714337.1.p2 GENE.EC714337.1~~EC714337.1.p2  ORF type:complete len:50 (-),score=4.56 EC714337.1:11-160(-)
MLVVLRPSIIVASVRVHGQAADTISVMRGTHARVRASDVVPVRVAATAL